MVQCHARFPTIHMGHGSIWLLLNTLSPTNVHMGETCAASMCEDCSSKVWWAVTPASRRCRARNGFCPFIVTLSAAECKHFNISKYVCRRLARSRVDRRHSNLRVPNVDIKSGTVRHTQWDKKQKRTAFPLFPPLHPPALRPLLSRQITRTSREEAASGREESDAGSHSEWDEGRRRWKI